ncbi:MULTISPECIES: hypothetical protein [unclassified Streptomyces]|uniref:hypothetical protein n=1 Tax=unclassified Streptomyces TaxID=2593676 RepID=UPI002E1953BF|nr:MULTISPECIES: hypothetical protein [unclassified Streptomyces]
MVPSPVPIPQENASHTYDFLAVYTGSSLSGAFDGTVTWSVIASAAVLVTMVYFGVIYRRRDKKAKQLEADYALLDKVAIELGKLEDITATKDDAAELDELLQAIKQAEQRFPEIPFGAVVATIKAYETTVLSKECAKKLKKKRTGVNGHVVLPKGGQ